MKKQPLHPYQSGGFTMIEVLVSLVILAIGILASSHYLGNAVVSVSDNNNRATALDIASQQLEPLYIAASTGATDFKTALDAFDANGDGVFNDVTVTGNDGKDTYTITILEAKDNSATAINLLTDNTPANWVSPYRIAVQVTYTGLNGTKTANATFTYIAP